MQLTDDQKAVVAGWVQDGLTLADVQRKLEEDFGVRMTYMDVRFLIDDLDLEVASSAPKFQEPSPEVVGQGAGSGKAAPGEVSVSLDKVSRPDSLVSGQVTFSDGVSAQWHLDQMGRLSLNPSQPGYQPSKEDVQKFQEELRSAVEKSGML